MSSLLDFVYIYIYIFKYYTFHILTERNLQSPGTVSFSVPGNQPAKDRLHESHRTFE